MQAQTVPHEKREREREKTSGRLAFFLLPFFFLLKNLQINAPVSPFVFPEKQQHTDKELLSKLSSPIECDSIQTKWSVLSMG